MTEDLFSRDRMSKQERAFKDYHKENPHVYELFMKFAREAKKRGYQHYSAYAIFERIRWHMEVETTGDMFKMNNNYRPFYARMAMNEFPEFDGFFRIRFSPNHSTNKNSEVVL